MHRHPEHFFERLSLRLLPVAMTAVLAASCGNTKQPESVPKVSSDELYERSRAAQNKAFAEASKYFKCADEYVIRTFTKALQPSDISAAAISNCSQFKDFYIGYLKASYYAMVAANPSGNWRTFELRMAEADKKAESDGEELSQDVRGVALQRAIQLVVASEKQR